MKRPLLGESRIQDGILLDRREAETAWGSRILQIAYSPGRCPDTRRTTALFSAAEGSAKRSRSGVVKLRAACFPEKLSGEFCKEKLEREKRDVGG